MLCLNGKVAAETQLPVPGTIAPRNSPLVAAFAKFNSAVVLAQTSPPGVPPGTIVPPRPAPPLLPDPLPTPTPPPQIKPSPLLPSEPSSPIQVKVPVKRVEVLGSTAFSAEELAEATAPFIGKVATFEKYRI